MPRLPACRHALPAVAVVLLSLLIPFLAQGGAVSAKAVSVTAKAAQNADVPGDQLFPATGPLFASAQRLATEHWGATACKGQVTMRWATLDRGTNATASWRNPTDAWNNAGENFDCMVELNTLADYDFPKLCTVLAHELGHLLGHPHAAADGELMSAVYSTPLAACESAAPDAASTAPAATQTRASGSTATPTRKAAARPAANKKRVLRTSTRRCVRRFSDGRRAKKRCVTVKKTRKAAAKRRLRR